MFITTAFAALQKFQKKASGHTCNKDCGLHGGRHLYRHVTIKAPEPSQQNVQGLRKVFSIRYRLARMRVNRIGDLNQNRNRSLATECKTVGYSAGLIYSYYSFSLQLLQIYFTVTLLFYSYFTSVSRNVGRGTITFWELTIKLHATITADHHNKTIIPKKQAKTPTRRKRTQNYDNSASGKA